MINPTYNPKAPVSDKYGNPKRLCLSTWKPKMWVFDNFDRDSKINDLANRNLGKNPEPLHKARLNKSLEEALVGAHAAAVWQTQATLKHSAYLVKIGTSSTWHPECQRYARRSLLSQTLNGTIENNIKKDANTAKRCDWSCTKWPTSNEAWQQKLQ